MCAPQRAREPVFLEPIFPEEEEEPDLSRPNRVRSAISSLGPGIIAGAANDDPCAIGTYAQAGAGFGFAFLWTAPFTFPMMAATVYLCSKLSLVTGKGIAGIMKEHYPRWLLYPMVITLLVANIIEAGADIGAIAASLRLLIPVPVTGITVAIAVMILLLQFLGSYQLLRRTFGWLALALFAYVGAAVLAKPHGDFPSATFLPRLHFTREYLAMLVAVIGTRLSPYLYFWESSQRVEQEILLDRPASGPMKDLRSTAWDVNAGMFFSNFIMYFVILCTAATRFHSGESHISTVAEAAQALRPLAGRAASLLFAAGVIGVGILAVPVLTTGPAHALAETFGWRHGLRQYPYRAPEFYAVIALSTCVAVAIGLSGINPLAALFWASVFMGLLAPPLMLVIMVSTSNRKIMGARTNNVWVNSIGWITTVSVTLAAGALIWSWIRNY
jgi:NRAMP (natural resistance-associated macrophage protein)-like metal ion transporter